MNIFTSFTSLFTSIGRLLRMYNVIFLGVFRFIINTIFITYIYIKVKIY